MTPPASSAVEVVARAASLLLPSATMVGGITLPLWSSLLAPATVVKKEATVGELPASLLPLSLLSSALASKLLARLGSMSLELAGLMRPAAASSAVPLCSPKR